MARNLLIIIFALVILAGAGYYAFGSQIGLAPRPTPTPLPEADEFENLVTASGTLWPVRHADLAFKIGGQVDRVAVTAGAAVTKGAVLVQLEASELEAALAQAQAGVVAAEADLKRLQAGPSKEDIAVAQANVDSARAQLARVRARAGAEEVAIAKAGLDRAAAALKDAGAAYDKVRSDPAVGMLPQSAALQAATQEYQIAEARYQQVLKGASIEEVRVAESAVAVAQANFERAQAGPRPEEIAAAEARIAQAQAAVQQAKAALASATLTAPFDGLIARVNVSEGETVTPGLPLIALGDVSPLRLETNDLSETNIARVKTDQPVDVTFEALPGKSFKGRVIEVAPISSEKQGGVNYTAYIELDAVDPLLRWGMTGHVEIKTQ